MLFGIFQTILQELFMKTNDIILNELVLERDRIVDQITELNNTLMIIQKLIDRRTRVDSESPAEAYIKRNALKPMQAIQKLFKENPDKQFIPSGIRMELEYLKERGLLITRSDKLLNVAHSSLKALIKKGVIIKNVSYSPPRYRLEGKLECSS